MRVGGEKRLVLAESQRTLMFYQLHRYIFKEQLFRGAGGEKEKKKYIQFLCNLPLRSLEFTDVGGHRKAPVHQYSLT